MRYRCLSCEADFDHDDSSGKARCPKCLRAKGLEAIDGSPSKTPSVKPGSNKKPIDQAKNRTRGVLVAAALVAVGVSTYLLLSNRVPDEDAPVPDRPLSASELSRFLEAKGVRGVEGNVFEVGTLGRFVTRGGNAAQSLSETFAALVQEGKVERWGLGITLPRQPWHPTEVAQHLNNREGEAVRIYPLEAAWLMVASLRASGTAAMLAEVYEYPGERKPADPSAQFGYFGVAIRNGSQTTLYDPWGGRSSAPVTSAYRVLSDVEVVGAYLSLRAQFLANREQETSRAVEVSNGAIRAAPRSPSVRAARGAILLMGGGAQEGLAELDAAEELRRDAARLRVAAGAHLALAQMGLGDLDRVRQRLSRAIEMSPDYAAAYADLAGLHLMESEVAEARVALERAETLDPNWYMLDLYWAQYYLAAHEPDQAVARAQRAVEQSGGARNIRLLVAQIYRSAGRYTEMRREAHAIADGTPASMRAQIEAQLRQVLGANALDPVDEDLSAEDLEAEEWAETEAGAESFRLGSKLLGDEQPGTRPSLLGGGRRPSLLGGGAGSSGQGGGLRLNSNGQ